MEILKLFGKVASRAGIENMDLKFIILEISINLYGLVLNHLKIKLFYYMLSKD
jgi:hypothetical protein